jgi:hypothetical protein
MRAMPGRVYIEDCCGLCNRMEIFVLAWAISRAFGHEIFLGWPELDVLQVEGTRRGTPGLLGRWGALRLRSCDSEGFGKLADRRRIILRGFGGPEREMASAHAEAIAKFSLKPAFAQLVAGVFKQIGARPVVGIHLRQGDFHQRADGAYDLSEALLSAVPLWWYEWAMHLILTVQPATCFLVCHNAKPQRVAQLKANFDVLEVPMANPYRNHPGHRSQRHPVADLFALACCPTILATPVSSFSHYAANILGSRSTCLMPPPKMSKSEPGIVRANVYREPLQRWVDASCSGCHTEHLGPSLKGVHLDQTAQTAWLQPTCPPA